MTAAPSSFHAGAEQFARPLRLALAAGTLFFVISIVGAFVSPEDFFRSYLVSYLFWFGLTLGSMAIVMLQYLTGGAWGILIRRPLESASQTLPLVALLFMPILFGIPYLYAWSHPDLVQHSEAMRHRAGYMNVPMFILRAVLYFAIWFVFAGLLNRWSARQDREAGSPLQRKLAALSAPGLIVYVFTVTFAAIDWAESLEPRWQSTMWGFLFVAGQGLSAIAFAIVALAFLTRRTALGRWVKPSHFQDLGKLLLMWVMIWAYFSFSQLLVVWAGNLTAEIHWYLSRLSTSWGYVGVLLIMFQFIVPFLLLLSRPVKRNPVVLVSVVGLLIVMRFVDLSWIVMPSLYTSGLHVSWLLFTLPVAMGGLWLAFFLYLLRRRPLLPVGAVGFEEVVHAEA